MDARFMSELRWNSHKILRRVTGRGVWESNPPGTAPSDPPAVLKTVRPTGAPTPPYVHVAWPYCAIDVLACQARLRIRSTSTSVSDFIIRSALRQPGRSRLPATAIQ